MKSFIQITIALSLVLILAILSAKEVKPEPMLSEYQEAYYLFLKKNPECAEEFSKIMDSLNTK